MDLTTYLNNAVTLRDAQSIVSVNETLVKNDPREEEELTELNTSIKESIDSLMDMIFAKLMITWDSSDPTITVQDRLFAPMRYMRSDLDGPGATEEHLFRLAQEAVDAVVEEVNTFLEIEWNEYKINIEEAGLTPFKEMSTIEKIKFVQRFASYLNPKSKIRLGFFYLRRK